MIRAILIVQIALFTWGGMFTAHTVRENYRLEMAIQKILYLRMADLTEIEVRL